MISETWVCLKAFINTFATPNNKWAECDYLECPEKWRIYCPVANGTLEVIIYKANDASDVTDFEDNYKSLMNQ